MTRSQKQDFAGTTELLRFTRKPKTNPAYALPSKETVVWAEDVGVTEPTASTVFCPIKMNRGTDAAHALQSRLGYGSPNLFSRRSFVCMLV
jgi:hypothetical protein